MEIVVEQVDVTQQLTAQEKPSVLIAREVKNLEYQTTFRVAEHTDTAVWRILQLPLDQARSREAWSQDNGGTHVHVPLSLYQLSDGSPEGLLKFALQLGTAAAVIAQQREAKKLCLFFSQVFSRQDGQPGFQVWAGMASKL